MKRDNSNLLHRTQGFTLIEVMITVAIIGILAAIALPSYSAYIKRGRMTDAYNNLATYALKQEQYFQNNNSYRTGATGTTCGTSVSDTSYFTFSCTANATTFTATATGSSSMTGYTFTINQAGAKATTKFAGTDVTKTCWLNKVGDC